MSELVEMFPVMVGKYGAERSYVPWSIVAPHEQQAQRNHSQTLKRLAERGGLAPCELAAVLEDRNWHRMDLQDAWRVIWRVTIQLAAGEE